MKLVASNKFKKSYKKFTKNNLKLKQKIDETLKLLSLNFYDNKLQTHKLSGKLESFLSCSCGFDCRIIFIIVKNSESEEEILLLDIGTHKEVY
jgi:addiction module RelE/StbE family toxin